MAAGVRACAAAIMAGAVLGVPCKATANPGEPLTIVLVVDDRAPVSEQVLERAKAEASRIYRSLAINLIWNNTIQDSSSAYLIVNVVSGPRGVFSLQDELQAKSQHSGVLGVAPGHRNRRDLAVWGFYERVVDTAAMLGIDPGVLLGHVIAHELGHLLLPYDSHSQKGIMRAGWDKTQATNAVMGTLVFDGGQSALIRRSVARLTAK